MNASSNTSTTYGAKIVAHVGDRVSNFLIQNVSYSGQYVQGLLYVQYPLAYNTGTSTTLHVNQTVGYGCDGTLKVLTSVNANNSATFTSIYNPGPQQSRPCPV